MSLLVLLAGCHPLGTIPDHDARPADTTERIAATPAELSFPVVSVNHQGSATLTFRVTNLGDARVTVTGQDEVAGGGPFAVDSEPLLALEPGETRDVAVTFSPPTDGGWTGDLFLEPGDEVVHLAGAATAPVLEVGEVALDPVVLGCSGRGTVAVTNRGEEALVFDDAWVTSAEFAVTGLPDQIAPGSAGTVELRFTPEGGGARATSLVLSTNDPATPQVAVPVEALGYEGEEVTETFHYAPSNPTDILFVVDTGATMATVLAKANPAIAAFVDTLRGSNVDYHLSAVGSGSPCPPSTPGFATRTSTALQSASVVQQGFGAPSGAWDDDLLGLAGLSLDQSVAGGCLEGFRREEGDLHVVAVTDGPAGADLSAQIVSLAGRAAGDAGFRLSALVALGGCGSDADVWAEAAETTGGIAADLCASDWVPAFLDLASLPPGADPVTYPLAEIPVPSSLRVTVEGAPFELWTYDTTTNAVRFDGDAVPALGAEVGITYVLAVACGASG